MSLALSKTLDPQDFEQLTEELQIVDQHFTSAREQHPMRRWEYAIAIRAHAVWWKTKVLAGPIYDVGGAGSPFFRMLDPYQVLVVDPQEVGGEDLAARLRTGPRLGQAVFCLSVLEHVDDLDRFCYHLACLVAPGGLLFLTMDYCDGESTAEWPWVVDRYHFSWMRQRIFNAYALGQLTSYFLKRDFSLLGPADFSWHGPTVYDYSFCSLALIKRP